MNEAYLNIQSEFVFNDKVQSLGETAYIYADNACQFKVGKLEQSTVYTISNLRGTSNDPSSNITAAGSFSIADLDIKLVMVKITPLNSGQVNLWNNANFCGQNNWYLNAPVDVSGKTCNGFTFPELNTTEYTFAKYYFSNAIMDTQNISKESLFLGVTDGSFEPNVRCVPIRDLALKRMVHPLISPAISSKPHDFIHLYFRNYKPDHSQIAQLYQSGLSLREIQIKTGVTKSSVRRSLIKSGVRIRSYSKELNKQSGLHACKSRSKPPFGFWFIEGQITKHPKEYPVLHQIIKRWKSGQSLNSISETLNRQQIRSPRGRKWSWNSVATIIERIKTGILIQKGENYELR